MHEKRGVIESGRTPEGEAVKYEPYEKAGVKEAREQADRDFITRVSQAIAEDQVVPLKLTRPAVRQTNVD